MGELFENRYYTTHNMMAEFARKYSIGPRWPVAAVTFLVYAFVAIPAFAAPDTFSEIMPALTVMGVAMVVVLPLPHWYTWATLRGIKKQNDGQQPEAVITFGETIELREGMVHITLEYRKLVRVVRLKYSYMLMIGKRRGLMLDPNGFTKGTFEEFKQFLREKRPDLTVPE